MRARGAAKATSAQRALRERGIASPRLFTNVDIAGGPETAPSLKAAFQQVFNALGGVPALLKWGRKNPSEFKRLGFGRLIEKQSPEINADGELAALYAREAER